MQTPYETKFFSSSSLAVATKTPNHFFEFGSSMLETKAEQKQEIFDDYISDYYRFIFKASKKDNARVVEIIDSGFKSSQQDTQGHQSQEFKDSPRETKETKAPKQKKINKALTGSANFYDLPEELVVQIARGLSVNEIINLLHLSKDFYSMRDELLRAVAENATVPMPEILIDVINKRDTNLIIKLLELKNVRRWINLSNNKGETAARVAFKLNNPFLFAKLLSSGLELEKNPGLMQLIRNNSLKFEYLSLFRAFYADNFAAVFVDGFTLEAWEYNWLQEQEKFNPAMVKQNQLIRAINVKDEATIASLLNESDLQEWISLYNNLGNGAVKIAVVTQSVSVIQMMLERKVDVRSIMPEILKTAEKWLTETIFKGIYGDAENIGKFKSLIEILLKFYPSKVLFSSQSLKEWDLWIKRQEILFRDTQVERAVRDRDYVSALSLVEQGENFMFDLPSSNPQWRDAPHFFDLVIKQLDNAINFSSWRNDGSREGLHNLVTEVLQRLTPETINQLYRGQGLIHYFSKARHCHRYLEILCGKPGVKYGLLNDNGYPALYYLILQKDFAVAQKLINFGAQITSVKDSELKYLWKKLREYDVSQHIDTTTHLLNLGFPLFDLVGITQVLGIFEHSDVVRKYPASIKLANYQQFIDVIIKTIPIKNINNRISIKECSVTLLQFLAENGLLTEERARKLIAKGANVNTARTLFNGVEITVLTSTWLKQADPKTIVLLLRNGAEPGAVIKEHLKEGCNNDSETTLRLTKILIDGLKSTKPRSKINDPMFNGQPLMFWLIVNSKRFEWTVSQIEKLIERGRDYFDFNLATHIALMRENFEVVDALKKYQPKPERKVEVLTSSVTTKTFPVNEVKSNKPQESQTIKEHKIEVQPNVESAKRLLEEKVRSDNLNNKIDDFLLEPFTKSSFITRCLDKIDAVLTPVLERYIINPAAKNPALAGVVFFEGLSAGIYYLCYLFDHNNDLVKFMHTEHGGFPNWGEFLLWGIILLLMVYFCNCNCCCIPDREQEQPNNYGAIQNR